MIHRCAVFVGGCASNEAPVQEVIAIRDDLTSGPYTLAPLPEPCGVQAATCVWKNELYVSRGSKEGTVFLKYSAASNEWEKLPELKHGAENQAMAGANGRIYLIGGFNVLRKVPFT